MPVVVQILGEIKKPNRADHVWFPKEMEGRVWYKCCLCGGVAEFPGPDVLIYHPLTEEERSLCPPNAKKK